MRAKGEVGVQLDTQDFKGSVQRSHRITNSHLRVESGLVGIGSEQCHAKFLGSKYVRVVIYSKIIQRMKNHSLWTNWIAWHISSVGLHVEKVQT